MSLANPDTDFKLKILLASTTKEKLVKWIQNYNEKCIANDLKDKKLKGYSKKPYNTKEGLIDFLLERLSDEEKEEYLKEIEQSSLEKLFQDAQLYLKHQYEREKIESMEFLENGLSIKFKGWQWETEITIELSSDGALTDYDCTCRIGKMEGFCPHLFTGILALIEKGKFKKEQFLFKIPESYYEGTEIVEGTLSKHEELDTASADIVLGEDYLISINGNLVTLEWGGDRAGKTTKDVTKEKKPVPVKEWVAKKVVEKILAPLRARPNPREIFKDEFGVVPIIVKNEDLINKLLKKFIKTNEEKGTNLPATPEELKIFLKQHL